MHLHTHTQEMCPSVTVLDTYFIDRRVGQADESIPIIIHFQMIKKSLVMEHELLRKVP